MYVKQNISLRYLTIKPTDVCGYSCPYCAGRQALFGKKKGESLSLFEWQKVLQAAQRLGVVSIRISGGEPTLFNKLPQLVALARSFSDYVQMYSNGRLLSSALTVELADQGLGSVSISLLSLDAQLNDRLRQTPGSHSWSVRACQAVAQTPIHLSIHVIVCRHNYREIPDFIRYAHNLGAKALELHYPENDIDNKYLLMTDEDILFWRQEVVDKCTSVLEELKVDHADNVKALKKFYAQHATESEYSDGIYWSSFDDIDFCTKPKSFAMIYPNGDVLPCNGVEYAHKPIVGNVRSQSLDDIWKDRSFQEFRINRTSWCRYCPMMLHTRILLD